MNIFNKQLNSFNSKPIFANLFNNQSKPHNHNPAKFDHGYKPKNQNGKQGSNNNNMYNNMNNKKQNNYSGIFNPYANNKHNQDTNKNSESKNNPFGIKSANPFGFNKDNTNKLMNSQNLFGNTQAKGPSIFGQNLNIQNPKKEQVQTSTSDSIGKCIFPVFNMANKQINTSLTANKNEFVAEIEKRDAKIMQLQSQINLLKLGLNQCLNNINNNNMGNNNMNSNMNNNMSNNMNNYNNNMKYNNNNMNHGYNYSEVLGNMVLRSQKAAIYQFKQYRLYIQDSGNAKYTVKIENNHGKIIFKEPIQIHGITTQLCNWVQITNQTVTINIEQLRNKKCDIIFFNFMGYLDCTTPESAQIIVDCVSSYRQTINNQVNVQKLGKIQKVDFNFENGQFYVRSQGL